MVEEKKIKKEKIEVPEKVEAVEEEIEVLEEIEEEENTPKVKSEISLKPTTVKEAEAVINIYTSFNNTIVHVTDMSGKTITKVTGGMVTKHSRLKANPTIGMFIAKRIAEEVKDSGIKSFYVRIRAKTRNPAPGPGANTIVKSLTREGFRILNILDYTRFPRGGPKKQGGRRGRRP
jgi:small subunit ribosomal protein S11